MTPRASRAFDNLCREAKFGVFRALEKLLQAENPLRVKGVAAVQGMPGVWRIHADGAAGAYRLFFTVVGKRIEVCGFEYRGEVIVLDVRKKDTNTYR